MSVMCDVNIAKAMSVMIERFYGKGDVCDERRDGDVSDVLSYL